MPPHRDSGFRDFVLDQLAGLPGIEARAMTAFAPGPKQSLKNYLEVPGGIIDDAGLLREWALAAARRPEQ